MAKKLTLLKGERLTPLLGKVTRISIFCDICVYLAKRAGPEKIGFFQSTRNNLKLHSIEALYKSFLLLQDGRLILNID